MKDQERITTPQLKKQTTFSDNDTCANMEWWSGPGESDVSALEIYVIKQVLVSAFTHDKFVLNHRKRRE